MEAKKEASKDAKVEGKKEGKTEGRKETGTDGTKAPRQQKGKGPDNEVRVKVGTYIRSYLAYVARLFEEKQDEIVVRGMGAAIPTAVRVATLVRARFKGIHQIAELGTMEMADRYEEAYEAERGPRRVPYIRFILSKKELNKAHIGYMPPLPDSEVTEYKPYVRPENPPALPESEGARPPRRARGSFRRSRGATRGYGRGYYQRYEENYEEEGYYSQERNYTSAPRRSRAGPRRAYDSRPAYRARRYP